MKKEREIRNITTEFRADSESRKIEGFIPYNSRSEYMGFWEYLDRGCFDKTLRESSDIKCLYDHIDSQLLARTKNNSLRFEDREDGLHFYFDAPETTLGNDVLTMVRTGLISGCSFGFQAIKDSWSTDGSERHIQECRLFEVSVLASQPAYAESDVKCRSLSEAFKDKELSDEDKAQIQAEIEALQSMIPTPEPEPEKEPEGPTEEELEAQRQAEEEAQKIEALNAQIDELTSVIQDYTTKLEELEKEE